MKKKKKIKTRPSLNKNSANSKQKTQTSVSKKEVKSLSTANKTINTKKDKNKTTSNIKKENKISTTKKPKTKNKTIDKKEVKKTVSNKTVNKKKTNNKQVSSKNKTTKTKRKQQKLKKNIILSSIGIGLIIIIICLVANTNNKEEENHKSYVNINVPDNYSCILSTNINSPDINDENWTQVQNNICTFEYDDTILNYIFLKDEENNITSFGDTSGYKIENLTHKDTVYLVVGETYKLNLIYNSYNDDNTLVYSSSNQDVALVYYGGTIVGMNDGTSTITVLNGDQTYSVNVVVTSLLVQRPVNYDFDKPYISCEQYSTIQNDLIDKILEDKINEVGYGTRAGVVEAMRFLTLDFPYKITYMYENGRLAYDVDGEGRYYHKGLYLSKSKYQDIKDSAYGPGSWGCPIYQYELEREADNGLDCSGLVTWAMLNGGYDIGDIGAGGSGNGSFALWNVGERVTTTKEIINKIKAGDLVHSEEAGGHIGMVVGIDDNHIYVAQALWTRTVGCVITTYTYDEFVNYWNLTMLMDSYYEKDGNYTAMWY